MNVLRIAVAVFFILGGLGGLVSGVRKGQLFDIAFGLALLGVAYALWPRKSRSRT